MSLLRTLRNRANGQELPEEPEIERFGADGEEQVYEVLASAFDTVIRSPALPHKELFLEKDFLVIYKGFPFVLEIKHWKGEIGQCGDKFYQEKDNGVRKTVKSPVGTTAQFIKRMKAYYKLKGEICGVVVFSEPDCTLSLPEELEGNVRDITPGTTFGVGVDNNGKVYTWGYTKVTDVIDLKDIPEEVLEAEIEQIAATTAGFSPKIRSATSAPVVWWRVLGFFRENSPRIIPWLRHNVNWSGPSRALVMS